VGSRKWEVGRMRQGVGSYEVGGDGFAIIVVII